MYEYIERKAIRDALYDADAITMSGVKILNQFPAADVTPVRHGRWEIVVGSNGKEYMVCTCCRVSQDLTGVFTYCPNCGCRMDGGDDE